MSIHLFSCMVGPQRPLTWRLRHGLFNIIVHHIIIRHSVHVYRLRSPKLILMTVKPSIMNMTHIISNSLRLLPMMHQPRHMPAFILIMSVPSNIIVHMLDIT